MQNLSNAFIFLATPLLIQQRQISTTNASRISASQIAFHDGQLQELTKKCWMKYAQENVVELRKLYRNKKLG